MFAKGGNISVAKAESFVKNFFDLIIEGLEQDGIVKINGLGTFKVTDVASRGSVNVNTGEKIEIKGHRKLTFIPADALKEQVNLPFAMFEPVEVDDTYQPDSADINEDDEVADAVADAAQIQDNAPIAVEESAPAETTKEEVLPEKSEDAATVDEPTTTVAENFTEESVATDDTAELGIAATEEVSKEKVIEEGVEQQVVETGQPVKDADSTVQETPVEHVKVQERPAEPVVVRVPKKKSTEEKQPATPKRRNKRWSFAVIAIMVIAVGFVIYNRMESAAIVAEPDEPKPVVLPGAKNEGAKMAAATFDVPAEHATVAVAATIDTSAVQPAESEKVVENTPAVAEEQPKEEYTFVMVEELAAMPLKDITVADTLLYVADGELAGHVVAPDETLTKIARHYFGDKKLWPYIVKYNGMRDPNGLCSGMTISIPRLKPVR